MKVIALFNSKIKLGVDGRKETFNILKTHISKNDKTIWCHCASLGEYEQGLPVFEAIRKDKPNYKIVLSFFSPSGYHIRKNSPIADVVVYLPLDTKNNATQFMDLVHPELALFVKYDIWPNYLKILNRRNINTLLISALFRKNQIYFKWPGGLMRQSLKTFNHIFVQDDNSKNLLKTIDYENVTISGDTRFDRVSKQLEIDNKLPEIETFISDKTCIVCGSTWPEDEALLIDFINSDTSDTKYIIAPHNIKPKQISQLQNQLRASNILHSKIHTDLNDYKVLIIDCIGLLSRIYSYADISYVGGAMGTTGLHNILEPAVFGIPVVIGKHFKKFPEAEQLLKKGGLYTIKNNKQLHFIFSKLIENKNFTEISGDKSRKYIEENKGAVIQIMNYIRTYT